MIGSILFGWVRYASRPPDRENRSDMDVQNACNFCVVGLLLSTAV